MVILSLFTFSTHCITIGLKYKLHKQSLRVDACRLNLVLLIEYLPLGIISQLL